MPKASTSPGRLRRFFADYGKYDTVVKEVMLDTWIPSQEAPRANNNAVNMLRLLSSHLDQDIVIEAFVIS